MVEDRGFLNLTQAKLSEELGVSQQQISRDIKHLKRKFKITGLEDVKINLDVAYKKALKELMLIIADSKNTGDRLEAIRAVKTINEGITKFMEDFGFKDKVANKLEVHEKVASVEFSDPNDKYPDIESENRQGKEKIHTDK